MMKLNSTAVGSLATLVISLSTLTGCKSTDEAAGPSHSGTDTSTTPIPDTVTVPTSIPSATERQITFGPNQHFYGYQGHAGNTPFNHSGTKLALLEVQFQDRLVTASDAGQRGAGRCRHRTVAPVDHHQGLELSARHDAVLESPEAG